MDGPGELYGAAAVGYIEMEGTVRTEVTEMLRRKLKAKAPISSVSQNKWSRAALSNLCLFFRAAVTEAAAHTYRALPV